MICHSEQSEESREHILYAFEILPPFGRLDDKGSEEFTAEQSFGKECSHKHFGASVVIALKLLKYETN